MNYIRHLNAFFTQIKSDDRLSALHVSLYLALFQYWNFNRFQNPFPVYRDNIMQLSKIGSKNTYHKCVKHLHQNGYIIYHPAPSKYLPVKISMIRFDIKLPSEEPKQLDLFSPPLEGAGGRLQVPHLTSTSPKNDMQQVPEMGQYIKQNFLENSVKHTPTSHSKDEGIKSPSSRGAQRGSWQVSNLGHAPLLEEVEAFFKEQFHDTNEARKFFYYNQSKNWMLTDRIPIYDWKAIAQKWMLNEKDIEQDLSTKLQTGVQFLYDQFLAGEKINKLILPEYADHLQLTITETILQQAWQRRINQLSGSNENSQIKLWHAYMQGNLNDQMILKDQPNLIALAKRLAVSKHFQKLKSKGQKKITSNEH